MLFFIQTLLPLAILIFLGSILKLTIANNSWSYVLNKLVLALLLPALILDSVMKIQLTEVYDFSFIYVNIIILTTVVSFIYILLKVLNFSTSLINTYVITVFFGNIGYLGFPIITSILPSSEGVVSIHIAIYTLILFSLGLGILEYSIHQKLNVKVFKKVFKNPLLLATISAILLLSFNIKLPPFIDQTINILSISAIPIMLISLGIFLTQKIPKIVDYTHVAILVTLKLIFMPTLFYLYFIYEYNSILIISILEAAMPIAITPFILSETYPMEKEIIIVSIILSSILSIITLPLLMIVLDLV